MIGFKRKAFVFFLVTLKLVYIEPPTALPSVNAMNIK